MNFRYTLLIISLLTLPLHAMEKGKATAPSWGSWLTSGLASLVITAVEQPQETPQQQIERLLGTLADKVIAQSVSTTARCAGFNVTGDQGTIALNNLLGFSLQINPRQGRLMIIRNSDKAVIFNNNQQGALTQDSMIDTIARSIAGYILPKEALTSKTAAQQRAIIANVELVIAETFNSCWSSLITLSAAEATGATASVTAKPVTKK